ncbi:hypothetical protein JCM6882_007497 [Rhodosporidiobolus microsporus]
MHFDLLPDEVLERIFLSAYTYDKKQASDTRSWILTCKRWRRIAEPLRWFNPVFTFSTNDNADKSSAEAFGSIVVPRALGFLNVITLVCFRDQWLVEDLHIVAPFLVWLKVDFGDQPGAGLRNIRICPHLERLSVACPANKRGNLGDILDTVSHLPHLTTLALQSFEAPSSPRLNTAFAHISTLHLRHITGPEAHSLLLAAFPRSPTFRLERLVLSHVPFPTSVELPRLHSPFLVGLSVDFSERDLVEAGTLFFAQPVSFPNLKDLAFDFHGGELRNWLGCLIAFSVATAGAIVQLPKLERFFVAKPLSWSEEQCEELLTTGVPNLRQLWGGGALSDAERLLAMLESPAVSAHERVYYLVTRALALPQLATKLRMMEQLWMEVANFTVEEVLRKGAGLRREAGWGEAV